MVTSSGLVDTVASPAPGARHISQQTGTGVTDDATPVGTHNDLRTRPGTFTWEVPSVTDR
jgi:hypothetical protein